VPAEVLSLDGREVMLERVLQGISSIRVTMRWRAGVQASDQLLVQGDGREFNITSAEDPDLRREQLVILANTEAVQS